MLGRVGFQRGGKGAGQLQELVAFVFGVGALLVEAGELVLCPLELLDLLVGLSDLNIGLGCGGLRILKQGGLALVDASSEHRSPPNS
ncbi:hypothetical protein M8I35_13835 [Micromonospora sp. MSM11]|nr:hypothetical protein [Micromonospora sp. MSM11]MCL7458259.1 hypothetical protein [Micromonospora sp. MSM11]